MTTVQARKLITFSDLDLLISEAHQKGKRITVIELCLDDITGLTDGLEGWSSEKLEEYRGIPIHEVPRVKLHFLPHFLPRGTL